MSRQRINCDHSGFMTKIGHHRRSWKKRFFVLDKAKRGLLYFRSKEDYQSYLVDQRQGAKGVVRLSDAHVYCPDFVQVDGINAKYCLEITTVPPAMRHYFMVVETAEEFYAWIRQLSLCSLVFASDDPKAEWVKHVDLSAYSQSVFTYGKQGFLEKRGRVNKSFKKRFFRIGLDAITGQACLAYYKRFDSLTPFGAIPLLDKCIVREGFASNEFGIKTEDRTFVIKGSSDQDVNQWVTVIERICQMSYSSSAPRLSLPSIIREPARPVDADAMSIVSDGEGNEASDVLKSSAAASVVAGGAKSADQKEVENEEAPNTNEETKDDETSAQDENASGAHNQQTDDAAEGERDVKDDRGLATAPSESGDEEEEEEETDWEAVCTTLLSGTTVLKHCRKSSPHERVLFGEFGYVFLLVAFGFGFGFGFHFFFFFFSFGVYFSCGLFLFSISLSSHRYTLPFPPLQ